MPFIQGFGAYLPERRVSNWEIAKTLGCDPEWILTVSGIAERRFAAGSETVADLAVRASEKCLERSSVSPSSIGLLVMSSGSMERRFPGPGSVVARRLGLGQAPAVDLVMASAGSLFGLALASQLAPTYGNVLVVGAEKMSTVVQNDTNKNTAILFGDGAGACLVSKDGGLAEIRDVCLFSDGSFAEDLKLTFPSLLEMNGGVVIMQASRKIPSSISCLLERNRIPAESVGAFLMHQANKNLIVRVAQSVGVPPEKFFSNIERYGNTSSASMLIAAYEWEAEFGFRDGVPIVFSAFGAGFHWGSLLAVGSRDSQSQSSVTFRER